MAKKATRRHQTARSGARVQKIARQTSKKQSRSTRKSKPRSEAPRQSPGGSIVSLIERPLEEEVVARRAQLDRERRAAQRVLNRHAKRLMARKGVVGVDVGLKITNDQYVRPAKYVIRIHVEAKLGDKQLSERARLPEKLDGIEVDVLERRYVQGANGVNLDNEPELRRFRDPLSGGVAISGDKGATFGTLGMRVFKNGTPMYLTNAHVVPTVGAEVWQPPTKGPNTPVGNDRVIGVAAADRARDDRMDCALIIANQARTFQGLVLDCPKMSSTKLAR